MTNTQRQQIINLILANQERVLQIARRKGGYATGFQDGNDLIQDLCAVCLQQSDANPDFLLNHNEPSGKILAIARNLCVDAYRRAARFPFERVAKSTGDSGSATERLHDAIASLPPKVRDVINYRLIEQRSRTEVAEMLHISVDTVTRRQHQGIARLKDDFDVSA